MPRNKEHSIYMSKKILAITGSPRKNGNSDTLAEAFLDGAKSAGHSASRFDAGRKKILPCRACQKCYANGAPCVFGDDFNELAPMIESADAVVFATPLYFYSFSAQIKAAIDKMYSFYVGERNVSKKKAALLACGETDIGEDFDGIVKSFRTMADFMEWEVAGVIAATGVEKKGDISGNAALQKAYELGAGI